MSEQRDRKERAILADTYMVFGRCIGGHVTVDGYVCQWCESNDPRSICFKEKIRLKSERPSYYDEKTAQEISKFRAIEK